MITFYSCNNCKEIDYDKEKCMKCNSKDLSLATQEQLDERWEKSRREFLEHAKEYMKSK